MTPDQSRSSSTLSAEDYRALLALDLPTFTQRVFHELHPEAEFRPSPYLEVIASRLEDCRLGRTRRLVINVPPRHTKSILASVAFPAWLLGHDPGLGVICASYGQDLSDAFARQCRTVMTSDWYEAVFATRIVRNAVQDFATAQKGYRFATSVGGVLTGRGADVVILDDALKPDEALSDARRNAVNDWLDNSLLSRLNNQATGVIIIVAQRLHMGDLVGHVLEKGGWETLSLPALAEEDERIAYQTLLGPRVFERRVGQALHPERFSRENLEELRRSIGAYNFAAQYQQSPVPLEGNLVKRAWLARYAPEDADRPFPMVVQSWDTANKAGELNDHSVCTTWGARDRRYYLLDVFRKRLEFPDLKRAVRELASRHRPRAVLIEDQASGTQLVQELSREGLLMIKAVQRPAGADKIMRLHMHSATFENGRVLLPREATWLDAYVAELTGFPGAKHDDQVDSTTQALSYLDAFRPPMTISNELLERARRPTTYSRRLAGY
jgi:predicted phage terminase large subunit-like protein